MNRKIKGLHCLWYALAELALVFLYYYTNGLFESVNTRESLRIISDGCVLCGVLFACIAALTWAGTHGTYDMLGYSMQKLFFFVPSVREKTEKTFYDYRHKKDEEGRKWLPEMLLVGLGFLLVGVIVYFVRNAISIGV